MRNKTAILLNSVEEGCYKAKNVWSLYTTLPVWYQIKGHLTVHTGSIRVLCSMISDDSMGVTLSYDTCPNWLWASIDTWCRPVNSPGFYRETPRFSTDLPASRFHAQNDMFYTTYVIPWFILWMYTPKIIPKLRKVWCESRLNYYNGNVIYVGETV